MTKTTLALLTASLILMIAPDPVCSAPARFSKAQIEKVQASIQNSKNLSDRSFELIGNAHRNSTIASSNFDRTGIGGFRQASDELSKAERRFSEARKKFDDAWIKMQHGLERNDLGSVQDGINLHNTGAQIHKEGLDQLNKALRVFEAAVDESKASTGRRASTVPSSPNINLQPQPRSSTPITARFPGSSSNIFPAAAVIVLLGTVMTSIQAFKDRRFLDRLILHPWSIVRHGKRQYTLLTSGLIHADAIHLTVNLMSFCFFAFILETITGHLNFLIIYFGSLIFSSFVATVKNGNNACYRALGASGAIAGVIFSYILYRPNSKISLMLAPVPIPAPVFALLYLAYSYYMGKHKWDNVGHEAHLWGAISGALITMILDPSSIWLFRSYLKL